MAILRSVRSLFLGTIGAGALVMFAAAPSRAWAVRAGDALPSTTFTDWQGDSVRVGGPRAGVMVIDFWASWCQTCRAALPELNTIAQRYAAAGVQVVAVNIDKTQSPADEFLKTYVPTSVMILLRDPGGGALARYGASGMPALYVVDQRGVVRLVESGYTVEKLHAVETLVEQLLDRGGNP
jgi:thiol-disulfide isomerase/thioredoxin